ncbi:Uma2 family endonuclease [Archangium primigenium]|uniref:Uma2 family endonuclease n=1 Tax=[Archangium] primigenium TaxID=2792470 RepID=UPI001958A477|nr:Uma2 family endonuclease [Archangium primigenium]MBM7112557.1 Uma2 family endonuclease [Archangium primigenium]
MGQRKKPATYEDIEALPVGWVGELLEDELVAAPRPALGHARVCSMLGTQLGGPFDLGQGGPGGWWLFFEPEIHLGRDVLVPDLAGWRRERLPGPPAPSTPFMTVAPDWVCEVLSPSTQAVDRERKLPRYHREGVGHVWLVEPLTRTLDVLRWGAGGWSSVATHQGPGTVHAEPFQAVALQLAALWL